jgi:lipopolysaccharide/colanic/teichoic acid biosynthesis glycosyltransferase
LKRLFDILVSFSGLILFSPLLLIIALIIKLEMSGPVFFIQERVGRKDKLFRLFKFRTMSVAKEALEEDFDMGDNTRITALGKILRRTKLDELPQLVNVLKGEMSIVGPRPEVKKWTKVYADKWAIVHSVKPGITDNASIEFRTEEETLSKSSNPEELYRNIILPCKLDLYVDYVNNHTFYGDILIILRTLKTIIFK